VFRSLDNGDTWEQIGLAGFYINSLVIDSQNNLYAGSIGNNGLGIFCSQDNGETWAAIKTDVFVSGIALLPNDHIYIACTNEHGTQGGVFCSTDYGESWEMLNTGLINENVEGIHYSSDGYLYVYGYYLPLHRSNYPVYTSSHSANSLLDTLYLYPNPVSDFLFIELKEAINNEAIVELNLINLTGCIVFEKKFSGIEYCKLDLYEVPAGIYVLSIKTTKHNYKHKILKI
jgi:hypothetical protein